MLLNFVGFILCICEHDIKAIDCTEPCYTLSMLYIYFLHLFPDNNEIGLMEEEDGSMYLVLQKGKNIVKADAVIRYV